MSKYICLDNIKRVTAEALLALAALLVPSVVLSDTVTESVIYDFSTYGTNDGAYPEVGLVQGSDGNFYGTSDNGGATNHGAIFKITSGGTLTLLYSFGSVYNEGNIGDKAEPGALLQALDGTFYGTTLRGGGNGVGSIFKLLPDSTPTDVYAFSSTNSTCCNTNGTSPLARLVQGTDGNFYGATNSGGANGLGTVFRITPSGTLTTLHAFSGIDGSGPQSGLTQGTDGTFYGTTAYGGSNDKGTVFKIASDGTLTTLHSFSGPDGSNPGINGHPGGQGMAQGSDGNFYGTTGGGGTNDFGTVFKITPDGTLTTLHSFSRSEGMGPNAGLLRGSDGNFYGTSGAGGAHDGGTAFKVTSSGALTVLYSFGTTTTDGLYPVGGLAQGSDGSFYGVTPSGGANGSGAVFKLAIAQTAPAIDLALSGTGSENSSGLITDNLTVSNIGSASATSTVVATVLPSGVSFVAAASSTGCMASGQTVTCTIGTLAGGTVAIEVVTAQASSTLQSTSITFSTSASQSDANSTNNSLTLVTTPPPKTDLSLSGSGSESSSGLVIDTLTIGNTGAASATGVVVSTTIPVGATLVTSSSSIGCTQSGQTVSCSVGSVPIGATVSVRIAVQLSSPQQSVSLAFSVTSNEGEANSSNNSATINVSMPYLTYRYDGNGLLSQRIPSTGNTSYLFYTKGGQLLGEYASTGAFTRENIYLGHALVAYENNGVTSGGSCTPPGSSTPSYLVTDPLASPVAATDYCNNVVYQQQYLPFGGRVNFPGLGQNDQWLTGKYQDDLSQLVNMGARQYSPAFGRFMSFDPAPVDPANHFSFNRYAYANNNPYRYKDPDGKSPLEIGFLIADTAQLVAAASSGQGLGLAIANEFIDVVGVASPIPGISEAAHGIEAVAGAAKLAERTAEIAKGAKPLYRSMSRAEAEAVQKTGKLRGGRGGETFYTDSRFKNADTAKDRLSLPNRPEVQMEFSIKNNPAISRNGTRVDPASGGRGGGREYMTHDAVEVEIVNVQPYR